MCGIAGLFSLSGAPVPEERVGAMCDLMRHRGPDDHGLRGLGPAALGHRRLSIIDLSPRGRNPMPNEDETVWLVCNGEIYNYQELRRDLLGRGHRFRSDTDTEVILHLYEEHGPRCVELLNGMFAFAIYDQRPGVGRWEGSSDGRAPGRLLLARDRFGVKPLYYWRSGDILAFASEVKAFLALPDFVARPDPFALAEHLTFQNTFGERTLFHGVSLLSAGHYLLCEGGEARLTRYWDLTFRPEAIGEAEEWAGGLRERFEAATERQLMSDVPLGTYLSGGMDTGAISAVAARRIPGMHTFTCGFDVPRDASDLERFFDEREESRELARYLGTVHHELELGPDALAPALPLVVWHLDEPRVGISYQVYYTAELIRRHVTVVLSGVGGDELFAGYPWRYEPLLHLQGEPFLQAAYHHWMRFLTDEEKRDLFTDEVNRALGDFSTYESFRQAMNGAKGADPLHQALYYDFKTFLNGLLVVDDKLSMAHSVEARVPFLDNDLAEYAARMPSELKYADGQGKVVLRRAMEGLLPEETIYRRKQGFTPPDRSWYKGPNLHYVQDLILGRRALERGYFQPKALRRILDDHLHNRRDHRFLLWSLMCFEWWNRLFVDREPMPERPVGDALSVRWSRDQAAG